MAYSQLIDNQEFALIALHGSEMARPKRRLQGERSLCAPGPEPRHGTPRPTPGDRLATRANEERAH